MSDSKTKQQKAHDYYMQNKKRIDQYNVAYSKLHNKEIALKRKMLVFGHYGMVCQCGYNDLRGISIDHIHGGGTSHLKKVWNLYRWLIKNKFPKGFQTLCMNCNWIKRVVNKEYRVIKECKSTNAQLRAYHKYKLKIKNSVFDHYRKVCASCGYDDLRALSIDHINGNGSYHRKSIGRGSFYNWLIRNNFPNEFQTLCMCCQYVKREENNELNIGGSIER